MTSAEILEGIRREIDYAIEENILVLVEGKRDIASLKRLGCNNIRELDKPLFAIVEEIAEAHKEIIILTDLDDEGKKLYHRLARDLQRHGVNINNRLRELLFQTPLRHIEGLFSFLANHHTNTRRKV